MTIDNSFLADTSLSRASLRSASRRLFMRQAGALSAAGAAAAPIALNMAAIGSAAAQSASDYKALVCIFMFGGNDSLNMILPTDTASWTNYTTVRNQAPESIALMAPGTAPVAGASAGSPSRLGGILPIAPTNAQGRTYALHPLMGSLQTMFNTDKRLAIVANVGPLVMPTTKTQYGQSTFPRPASLFSHNDQQNTWQTFKPEGATIGWGGRLGDLLASQNSRSVFTSISAAGNAVWLSGQTVQQYQVGTNGAIRMGADTNGKIFGSTDVAAAMQRIVGSTRGGHVFETDLAAVAQRSIDAELTLRTALKPASDPLFGTAPGSGTYNASTDPKLQYSNPLTGAATFNQLAQQMQIVARMIDASSASGVGAKRQVFFVSIGGFDSHDNENRNNADLMARLAHAMRYFDSTLVGMGAQNKVTAFTASDFGRTFTSNGDGTDHGWGAHHFVMGGAVNGGDIYGNFPVLGAKNANNNNFDSSPNQLGNGSLIPETAVDQLGATLAKWFGVSGTDALTVFPNLANFTTRDLGFMKPG
jgi:uncharacterized protein (DUF1501 family)